MSNMSVQRPLKRRTFLKGLGLAAGATAFGGFGILRAQQPIIIGSAMPITGGLSFIGVGLAEIPPVVAAEVNAAGGLLGGRSVVVDGRDTQSTDVGAIDAALQLVNVVGVPAIVGPARTTGLQAASAVAIDNEVLLISPSSTFPGIEALDDNDLVFRTAPNDALQARVSADLAFNVRGYRNVAIIALNDDYGEGLASLFKKNFEGLGGTITSVSLYNEGTTDFSAELAAASAGNPDAIMPITFQEIEQLYVQAIRAGITNLDLFVDGNKNNESIANIFAQVGDAIDGIIGTGPGSPKTEGGARFPDLVKDRLGRAVGPAFEPQTYDATAAVLLAIESAGEASGLAIAAHLRKVCNPPGEVVTVGQLGEALEMIRAGTVKEIEDGTVINYEGAGGAVDFDDGGDVVGPIQTWTVQNGEIVNLELLDCSLETCAEADPAQY